MDKRALKRYMNKNERDYLKTNCFKYKDGYLITDSFSIIKLSKNYDLNIEEKDLCGLGNFLENFENNFTNVAFTFDVNSSENKENAPIDKNFEISIKLLKQIAKIIKPNRLISVLENNNKNEYMQYLIKIENTKTNEVAYLLPMRKF